MHVDASARDRRQRRTWREKRAFKFSWAQLYEQFRAEPDASTPERIHWFRDDAIRELKKLRLAWPELRYRVVRGSNVKDHRQSEGYLLVMKMRPQIPPKPDPGEQGALLD